MRGAVVRAALAAVAFVAWLGYLGYLVRHRVPEGAVLSRPQLLVSEVDVVAQVEGPGRPVLVRRVLYAGDAAGQQLTGEPIDVLNLGACRRQRVEAGRVVEVADFTGPGEYLLPLRPVAGAGARFEVVPTPPSPGFPDAGPPHLGPPRIYPATAETLAQYATIAK